MAPLLLWGRGGTDSRLACRAFLCGSWAQPAVVILEHPAQRPESLCSLCPPGGHPPRGPPVKAQETLTSRVSEETRLFYSRGRAGSSIPAPQKPGAALEHGTGWQEPRGEVTARAGAVCPHGPQGAPPLPSAGGQSRPSGAPSLRAPLMHVRSRSPVPAAPRWFPQDSSSRREASRASEARQRHTWASVLCHK